MNLENFADYLEHPARLYQLNYQELKNLVMAYPYNANLRMLLLLKGQMEKDDKADTYLHRAAAYTFDRAHLFDQLRTGIHGQEVLHEQEEMLELRELAELFHEMEIVPTLQVPPTEQLPLAIQLGQEELTGFKPEWQAAVQETDLPQEELDFQFPSPPESIVVETPVVEAPVAVSEPIEPPSPEPTPAAPVQPPVVASVPPPSIDQLAKDRLHQMLEKRKGKLLAGLSAATPPLAPPTEQKPPMAKKAHIKGVEQIARKSVTENEELVSETLARILVQQGQYQRALRMYEKLSLLFPEKTPIFAPIIENLQQKI